MEKFDFDERIERRGTGCVKWDSSDDKDMLPMWVADMDFRAAPAIRKAIMRRAEEGVYGYVRVPESYYDAVQNWFRLRHGWEIGGKDNILYVPGLVPALCLIIRALTKPGDGVIFQTPAYNSFFSSVRENGRRVIPNPLLRRETATGFTYEIDFEGLQRLASDKSNRLMVLCNPHNPSGRVWRCDELEKIAEIGRKNGLMIVSDEIHCEIMRPGFSYVPFATVDKDCVVCCSPTKGFNIAGLLVSNIITRNEELRQRISEVIRSGESNIMNPFGIVALQAAYNEGAEWLDALCGYLNENYLCLRSELSHRLPGVRFSDSESTYLAWMDVSGLGIDGDKAEQLCKVKGKVWINSGRMYGDSRYVRINYACSRAVLKEGVDRICHALGV